MLLSAKLKIKLITFEIILSESDIAYTPNDSIRNLQVTLPSFSLVEPVAYSQQFLKATTEMNFNFEKQEIVIRTQIMIVSEKVKLATVVKGDQKAPYSIATTLRRRGGCYSFPWITPLYPRYVP